MFKWIISACFFIGIALFINACKKDNYGNAKYNLADSSTSYFKIVHSSLNFRRITGKADSFNVYFNNQKVNGAFLTLNSMFPTSVYAAATGVTNSYIAVKPGNEEIKLMGLDSTEIIKFNKTFLPGRYYTLLLTDSMTNTRDSSKIFVEDAFNSVMGIIPGYFRMRFINTVYNDSASVSTKTNTVDIYSYARNTTIVTKVPANGMTNFGDLGFNPNVADTLYVTRTPSTTGVVPLNQRVVLAKLAFIPQSATVAGVASQRVYTFFYKGDGTLSSGTKARALVYYINK